MQITTFNPMILSAHSEEIITLFEELGFERRHQVDNIDNKDITSVRMKDANGFYVDITQNEKAPQTMSAIRMNVDNFDEAYEYLKSRGFVNTRGDKISTTGSAKATMMASPSGFLISLIEHIK
jgi:hypothetical protein